MTAAGSPSIVLFDWNGTLLDDMERARMASSLVREQWVGLTDLALQDFREAWSLPLSDHVKRLGVPDDRSEDAARAWSTHLAALDAPLSPGVSATLEALQGAGITIGVVSSASDEAVRRDLRDHNLDQRFDSVHCGVIQKGDVISRFVENAPAGAVWYVGDTKFDMVQARGAGAVAIGYTSGYDAADALHEGGAHHLIARLQDLIALIANPPGP